MIKKRSRRHALGQHFLHNPRILDKIIRIINPDSTETVLEIGAGKGDLTSRLAAKAGKVIAVERDPRLLPELRQNLPANVTLIEGDALELDFRKVITAPPVKLTGNLPYSISSPLLFRFLKNKTFFSSIYILLQRETAERITALPGSKKYSPLAIQLQNVFIPKIEFYLAPGAFSPPPKVQSAFLSLAARIEPRFNLTCDERFGSFLAAIFKHRRKKLINGLKSCFPEFARCQACLKKTGIDASLRPEQIPPEDLAALFNCISKK